MSEATLLKSVPYSARALWDRKSTVCTVAVGFDPRFAFGMSLTNIVCFDADYAGPTRHKSHRPLTSHQN